MRDTVCLVVLGWLGGCVITRPPELAERPRWKVVGDSTFDAGCASAHGFIRKSGKQGFGIALRVTSRGDCTFAIAQARLVFPSGKTVALEPPAPLALAGRSLISTWLPVRFDNNAAWNAGDNDATLELVTAGATWRLAVHQATP